MTATDDPRTVREAVRLADSAGPRCGSDVGEGSCRDATDHVHTGTTEVMAAR